MIIIIRGPPVRCRENTYSVKGENTHNNDDNGVFYSGGKERLFFSPRSPRITYDLYGVPLCV